MRLFYRLSATVVALIFCIPLVAFKIRKPLKVSAGLIHLVGRLKLDYDYIIRYNYTKHYTKL